VTDDMRHFPKPIRNLQPFKFIYTKLLLFLIRKTHYIVQLYIPFRLWGLRKRNAQLPKGKCGALEIGRSYIRAL
jgi:hypothetical protein